ncbi:hypothetical protein [Candidatus Electrothrix sp.]|uniref:hypothetical protein n=1 Tax=Candidatus Electrothrix sp. TaxID=2170559 RepID=UPI004056433A
MSTLQQYRFTVKIRFVAPVVSQAAGAIGHGIDTAPLLDQKGFPLLPGTLLVGNLREIWDYFAELSQENENIIQQETIKDWLGTKAGPGSTPGRGRLLFDAFWRAGEKGSTGLHHRIAIEQESGKVKQGALQVVSSPFAAGKEMAFSGGIIAWLDGENEAQELKKWLTKGLHSISAMGALKGAGFGRIIGIDKIQYEAISRTGKAAGIDAGTGPDDSGIGIILRPDRSFCFSRHLRGNNTEYNDAKSSEEERKDKSGLDNQFVSEDFIPGGAIKGALATFLRGAGKGFDLFSEISNSKYPLLSQYLDQLCITRAQPSLSQVCRPLPLPLTTVAAEDSERKTCLYDIALMQEAGLINGQAPTFFIDWKNQVWELAAEQCVLPARPSRSLSIHTAIDSTTGASEDHKLFSIEAVEPGDYCWLANITLPTEEGGGPPAGERAEIFRELVEVLEEHGLHWLGKTGASAAVEVRDKLFRQPVETIEEYAVGTVLTLTLLSHARLLKPGQIAEATGAHDILFNAYAANWFELSGESLRLVDFYAAQELLGGEYWHKRFNKSKPYNPEIFTVPGSVFVVEISDEGKAKEKLRDWQLCGLPQLDDVSSDWQKNPWIRENGFGEIAVNLEQHRKLQPKSEQWTAIGELAEKAAGGGQ